MCKIRIRSPSKDHHEVPGVSVQSQSLVYRGLYAMNDSTDIGTCELTWEHYSFTTLNCGVELQKDHLPKRRERLGTS